MTNNLFAVILIVLAMAVGFSFREPRVLSGAVGVPSVVATTSIIAVSSSPILVFATSTCASRTVSTSGAGIMIGFSDVQGFVPSGSQGHWQGASTTVAYDSGQYGCGAVRIYSGTAQNITVSETR